MGKASGAARSKLVHHTDERIKLTNEVLQGIRVIKLYCWEKPIRELVDKVSQENTVK
jgi:ATP-binding cassette subfamily C (CFTR/MRP) protein 4